MEIEVILKSELDKILIYMHDKKNINLEEIYKLTNLAENFSINELVDTSLSKNSKKHLKYLMKVIINQKMEY